MGKKKEEKDKAVEEEVAASEDEEVMPAVSIEDELRAQNTDLLDKLQRSLAEFDNFRKRTAKEKGEMFDLGAMSVAGEFLPVIDNFERALSAASDKEDNMYKGLMMIYKQLEEALEKVGFKPIECIGQKFDPNLHNAVAHEKIEGEEDNIIIGELLKGYKYKDKVIRPSMVKVAN
ncbi:MAG: nucleotide exchange factor GrpE [Defluviitaleaceae bacterium]|nr:nucleotide exchange factor GrpE [Defluviitaleaceae bacterium]